jgi:hypothetical protein
MTVREQQIKREVEQALRQLPAHKMAEVLDFVLFLKKRCAEERSPGGTHKKPSTLTLHTMSASHLDRLTALVEWGGDALTDAERLYDDSL